MNEEMRERERERGRERESERERERGREKKKAREDEKIYTIFAWKRKHFFKFQFVVLSSENKVYNFLSKRFESYTRSLF